MRLESQASNQGLTDTTVIPAEIVDHYVGLAWEFEFAQAEVA
ncbi:hypothetical protein [Methylophilus sp. Leaf416]|nr:hypothetical protein [Methylophilus sp. Leaf416]